MELLVGFITPFSLEFSLTQGIPLSSVEYLMTASSYVSKVRGPCPRSETLGSI